MHELIGRVTHWTLERSGIISEPYSLELYRPNDLQMGKIWIYKREGDTNHLVRMDEPMPDFEIGLRTGRERFWGRVEYIIGRSVEIAGVGLYAATVLPSINSLSLSELNWGVAALGFGIFYAGRELASKGQQRKDIASTIINTFSNSDVIDHKTA